MHMKNAEAALAKAEYWVDVAHATFRGETTRYNRGFVRNAKRWLSRARRRLDKVETETADDE